jgi:hypothetical protein
VYLGARKRADDSVFISPFSHTICSKKNSPDMSANLNSLPTSSALISFLGERYDIAAMKVETKEIQILQTK